MKGADPATSPEAIARWATDADRLMDGENPRSTYPSDAAHWTAVYTELIRLKDELLLVAQRGVATLDPVGAHEIASSDVLLLGMQRERFRRRLDFWTTRTRELQADQPR